MSHYAHNVFQQPTQGILPQSMLQPPSLSGYNEEKW